MAQEVLTPQLARESVFRNGLIFGVILGAAQVIGVIVEWLTAMYTQAALTRPEVTPSIVVTNLVIRGGVSLLLSTASFLVMLVLSFIAGIFAARKTGTVSAGVFAGLLAGVLGALIGRLAALVAEFTLLAPYVQGSAYSEVQTQGMLTSAAILLVGGLLLFGGCGAGMGAFGGLVGRSRYQRAHPPAYQPPFYPGAP